VPLDLEQSVFWYRKAAVQGAAVAQANLGSAYHEGRGVAQDYAQAAAWTLKAAQQGSPAAQFNMGMAYGNGEGVERNPSEAYVWFYLASLTGQQDAKENLSIVAEELASSELAAAQWRGKALATQIPPLRSSDQPFIDPNR
jgi:TPR repeat protein